MWGSMLAPNYIYTLHYMRSHDGVLVQSSYPTPMDLIHYVLILHYRLLILS